MTTRGQILGDAVTALAAHHAATTKARRTAAEQAQSAIEHGWEGLAYEYEAASGLLENAATELSAARASLQQASSILGQEAPPDSPETGSPDALAGEVGVAAQFLEGACAQVDQARACAEVVGDETLIETLRELAEPLQTVADAIAELRDELEDEARA